MEKKKCQCIKTQQLWAAADCLSVVILWHERSFEKCNTRAVVRSIRSKPEVLGYHVHHNSQQIPKSAQPASDKFSFRDTTTVQFMLMGPWSAGRKRTTSLNHEKGEDRLHCIDPTHSLHQRRGFKVGKNAYFSSKIWSTAQTGLHTKWRQRSTVGADDNASDCTWWRRNKTLITLAWRLATIPSQLTFPQIYQRGSVRKGNTMKMYRDCKIYNSTRTQNGEQYGMHRNFVIIPRQEAKPVGKLLVNKLN
jgi:hypothetical protein